jgi:hypothetical protein
MADASKSGDPMASVTPEAVLIRVGISALLEVLGPKKGSQFLRVMARTLADEQALSSVLPINRPIKANADHARARQQAAAVFEQMLPMLLAKVTR